MAKKRSTRKQSGDGWSFQPASHDPQPQQVTTSLPPEEQSAVVKLDKRAKGKVVTTISNLVLTDPDLKKLGKALKNACGTGGTQRDGTIELQGDCRERAETWLKTNGWGVR